MNKRLVLAVVFVFTAPLQAYCDDRSAVPSSSVITVAQIMPVSPQAGTVRTPAAQTPPAVNIPPDHAVSASKEMLDAATQMWRQCPHINSGLQRLNMNPGIMINPVVRSQIEKISANGACGEIRKLLEITQNLHKAVIQAVSQGTPSPGTLQKGGPATLPKGGPAK